MDYLRDYLWYPLQRRVFKDYGYFDHRTHTFRLNASRINDILASTTDAFGFGQADCRDSSSHSAWASHLRDRSASPPPPGHEACGTCNTADASPQSWLHRVRVVRGEMRSPGLITFLRCLTGKTLTIDAVHLELEVLPPRRCTCADKQDRGSSRDRSVSSSSSRSTTSLVHDTKAVSMHSFATAHVHTTHASIPAATDANEVVPFAADVTPVSAPACARERRHVNHETHQTVDVTHSRCNSLCGDDLQPSQGLSASVYDHCAAAPTHIPHDATRSRSRNNNADNNNNDNDSRSSIHRSGRDAADARDRVSHDIHAHDTSVLHTCHASTPPHTTREVSHAAEDTPHHHRDSGVTDPTPPSPSTHNTPQDAALAHDPVKRSEGNITGTAASTAAVFASVEDWVHYVKQQMQGLSLTVHQLSLTVHMLPSPAPGRAEAVAHDDDSHIALSDHTSHAECVVDEEYRSRPCSMGSDVLTLALTCREAALTLSVGKEKGSHTAAVRVGCVRLDMNHPRHHPASSAPNNKTTHSTTAPHTTTMPCTASEVYTDVDASVCATAAVAVVPNDNMAALSWTLWGGCADAYAPSMSRCVAKGLLSAEKEEEGKAGDNNDNFGEGAERADWCWSHSPRPASLTPSVVAVSQANDAVSVTVRWRETGVGHKHVSDADGGHLHQWLLRTVIMIIVIITRIKKITLHRGHPL